jgi:hypothetical protein
MRQQQLESAVARATGESLRTIQGRGFSLLRPKSHRPSQRGLNGSSQVCHAQAAANDLYDDRLRKFPQSDDR